MGREERPARRIELIRQKGDEMRKVFATALAAMVLIAAFAASPYALAETIVAEIDLEIVKTADPLVVEPGDTVVYTLEAINHGPSGALAPFIVDELPPATTFVSASAGCTYDDASRTVECEIGPMLPGATASFEVTVAIDASASGTLYNEAIIENRDQREGAPEETDLTNNVDDATVQVITGSIGDFVWIDTDGDGVQDPGEAGYDGATVTLSGTASGSAATAGGGAYLFDGLVSGDYAVTITVPAGYSLSTPGTVNVALAPGQDFLDADFGLVPPAPIIDLEVTKTVDPLAVEVGSPATFTITVVNQGPDPATGVELTDVLPGELTLIGSATAKGTFDETSLSWTVGDLAVGESATLTMTVTVDEAGSFTNAVEVTAADQEDVDSVPGDGQGDDYDEAIVSAFEVQADAQIGDTVFEDTDGDGVQDAGEPGIAGAVVNLTGPGGSTSAVTDATGKYLFAALDAGDYVVTVDESTVDEDLSLTTALSFSVTLAESESYLDADFGFGPILPPTGFTTGWVAVLGMLLLLAGAGLVSLVRRHSA
jgi:uncharacterized repeat protein (TIGR01451 family)